MMKQTIMLTCAASLLVGVFVTGCKKEPDNRPLPTEGLVMHFSFNGNTIDEGLQQNNGTPSNVQWIADRKGINTSAAYFTGTDSYVTVPHSGTYNFATNQDYTISCWVKYGEQDKTHTSDNYILSKWHTSPSPGSVYPFSLGIMNQTASNEAKRGIWYSGRRDGNTCNNISNIDGVNAADGTWHHVVVVKKSTVLYGYMDGEAITSDSDNTTCGTQNTSPLYIGCYQPGANANDRWYKGALDDLRIYNRALSEEEINLLNKE